MTSSLNRDDDRPSDPEPWFDRPMRWGQLTLAENDPGQFDPRFWLDFFRRTHCDGVCLSAGGIVAYYPTQIPLHHRSAWMGDTDPFGDLVAGCRALGMTVIARTDPHAVRDEVREAHPDWIAVDADGKPRRHWANPELWVTCALGPYNFEFMTSVHREVMSSYDLNGIFSNRWAGHDICHCEHCEDGFAGSTGLPLPRAEHPSDPSYRKYVEWRTARLLALWDLWDGVIRAIRPGARFIPNGFPDRACSPRRRTSSSSTTRADRATRCPGTTAWPRSRRSRRWAASRSAASSAPASRRRPTAGWTPSRAMPRCGFG